MKVSLRILAIVLSTVLAVNPAYSADGFPDAVGILPHDYDSCLLYSEPDSKGKVLDFRLSDYSEFYADAKPIVNKKDKSRWYKVVYYWGYGDSMLRQVNKLAEFNNDFFYVRADDIKTSPVDNHVLRGIEWLREGRPPRFKVGDVLEFDEWSDTEKRIIIILKASAILLVEPKDGAQEIEVPEGLRLLGPIYATEDSYPNIHANMEEENWALMVDAITCKVLGWIQLEKLAGISEWIEPNIMSSLQN